MEKQRVRESDKDCLMWFFWEYFQCTAHNHFHYRYNATRTVLVFSIETRQYQRPRINIWIFLENHVRTIFYA